MQGSSGELREIAAEGLGELVEVTSQEALRPFTVQITGKQCSYISPGLCQHECLQETGLRVSVEHCDDWNPHLQALSSASSATALPGRSRLPYCTPWACSLARPAQA